MSSRAQAPVHVIAALSHTHSGCIPQIISLSSSSQARTPAPTHIPLFALPTHKQLSSISQAFMSRSGHSPGTPVSLPESVIGIGPLPLPLPPVASPESAGPLSEPEVSPPPVDEPSIAIVVADI